MRAYNLTVALLTLVISNTCIFASESSAWQLEASREHVTLSINGKITNGDQHRFIFFRKNCNTVQQVFSFYTTQPNNFKNLKGKVIVVEYNGTKIGGRIITSKKAMRGNIVMISLGSYEKDFILKHHQNIQEIAIKLLDGNGITITDYFDTLKNVWLIEDISKHFESAFKSCSR
tara:strand:- start:55 stop:576 length:522 start_codon:yes stop_codon:yes gene_type:complete